MYTQSSLMVTSASVGTISIDNANTVRMAPRGQCARRRADRLRRYEVAVRASAASAEAAGGDVTANEAEPSARINDTGPLRRAPRPPGSLAICSASLS